MNSTKYSKFIFSNYPKKLKKREHYQTPSESLALSCYQKPDKDTTKKKRKSQANTPNKNNCKNPWLNISRIQHCIKRIIPLIKWVHSRDTNMVQYSQINMIHVSKKKKIKIILSSQQMQKIHLAIFKSINFKNWKIG